GARGRGGLGQGGGGRASAAVADADLAELAAALPALPIRLESGHGDAAVWLEWSEGRFTRGMLDASFADVTWLEGAAHCDRLGASTEWLRTDAGWRIALNDVEVARAGRAWAPHADTVLELELDAEGGIEALTADSTFVWLEDLSPVAAVRTESEWARRWHELDPRGDIADFSLAVRRGDDGYEYSFSTRF